MLKETAWPAVSCCSASELSECACGTAERYLRHILNAGGTLNTEQREWCLSEIERVEGYVRGDYESEHDLTVARGVLNAWTDYCRDQGLL